MSDQVQIGIIGCGGNAKGHMEALSSLPDARLVATCDIVEALSKQAGEAYGARAYTDYRKMLERDDLDAVYLSLPVFAHGQPELDVIDRGLPFLVEKPVARTMETSRSVAEAVRKKGIVTCVGYQLRYRGGTDAAVRELEGETISLVAAKYWCGTGLGDPGHWTHQMTLSGGQILEQATHTIDMTRYLFGEIEEVYTQRAFRQLREIDCPDTHVVTLQFESGVLGSLTTNWTYDLTDWSHSNVIEVLYGQNLLRWDSGKVSITENGKTRTLETTDKGIDEVFVKAVRTKDSSMIRSPYDDAVKSLAVSLAIIESGEKGEPVRIAEVGI